MVGIILKIKSGFKHTFRRVSVLLTPHQLPESQHSMKYRDICRHCIIGGGGGGGGGDFFLAEPAKIKILSPNSVLKDTEFTKYGCFKIHFKNNSLSVPINLCHNFWTRVLLLHFRVA